MTEVARLRCLDVVRLLLDVERGLEERFVLLMDLFRRGLR